MLPFSKQLAQESFVDLCLEDGVISLSVPLSTCYRAEHVTRSPRIFIERY